MSDLEQRILEIIHRPQLAVLATVTEQNNPWVRYVITVGDAKFILRCASLVHSRKIGQIQNNPNVHLTCGVTSLKEIRPYLQIQGRARVTTSQDERYGFWNETLEPIFEGPDDPNYAVICRRTVSYRVLHAGLVRTRGVDETIFLTAFCRKEW